MSEKAESAASPEPSMPTPRVTDDMEIVTRWGGLQGYHDREASLREQVLAQAKEIERKDAAIREAVDLLTERKQGGHARSPNHNARLVLDAALSPAAQEAPKFVCSGCGSTETVEEIRRKHPQAISCCPERSMNEIIAAQGAPASPSPKES